MNEPLWVMPVPPSALQGGPTFASLGKRACELAFLIERDDGVQKIGLIFEGVEAYKCTYMTSRSVEMIDAAYGKLVRLGATEWLTEVAKISADYYNNAKQAPRNLQHLMICFDDGPCYEIICVGFKPI